MAVVCLLFAGCGNIEPQFEAGDAESIVKTSIAEKDILLYFPVHDLRQNTELPRLRFPVQDDGQLSWPESLIKTAMKLRDEGYSYDVVSDEYLKAAYCADGKVIIDGNAYKTILVPPCRFMEPKILERLLGLASDGASVLFEEKLPTDVPGTDNAEERREKLEILVETTVPDCPACTGYRYGKGIVMVEDLMYMLRANIANEHN